MSWRTQNAMKTVFNVFKRFKDQNGKVWNNEVEALKLLNTELEINQKSYINDNLLYAKLVCYMINQNLHHHGNIKTSIKAISDILKEPLDFHLQNLHKNLNHQDVINYLKSIDMYFETYKTDLNDLSKNEKEIIEKLKTNWTYENVSKSFYNTANDFLKETENYI